jgi:hypothetical protein
VESSCELGNEPSSSIKCWEFIEWLHNLWPLEPYSAPQLVSYLVSQLVPAPVCLSVLIFLSVYRYLYLFLPFSLSSILLPSFLLTSSVMFPSVSFLFRPVFLSHFLTHKLGLWVDHLCGLVVRRPGWFDSRRYQIF